MQKDPPVILMAMANDAQNSLNLKEEVKLVSKTLEQADDERRVAFKTTPGGATFADIIEQLNRFHTRLHIFHYCGHSDKEGLHLEDGSAQSPHLSKIFGMARNLRLVFLNGCSNREQVAFLQREGVKAVIATSTPIADTRALELAKHFYQALSIGKTIKESFETAKIGVEKDHQEIEIISSQYRGIDELEPKADFPWGLYYKNEEALEWHLALPDQIKPTVQNEPTVVGGVNIQLLETEKNEAAIIGGTMTTYPIVEEGKHPILKGIVLKTYDERVPKGGAGYIFYRKMGTKLKLGRGIDCDIVILDTKVSRDHAIIDCRGDEMYLIDGDGLQKRSANGTFWNDEKIAHMPIWEDGKLRLDDITFDLRVIFE